MGDNEGLDIGKVVSLIMENPALIEQIANLAKGSDQGKTTAEAVAPKSETEQKEALPVSSEATYTPSVSKKSNRSQLFNALKPYVSSERAKAIDSMMAVAEILDMMKAR